MSFSDLTTVVLEKKTSTSYEENYGEKTIVTLQYAGLKKKEIAK